MPEFFCTKCKRLTRDRRSKNATCLKCGMNKHLVKVKVYITRTGVQ